MTVSPQIVDLLWKRHLEAEKEFNKARDKMIRKYFKNGNTKSEEKMEDLRQVMITIIDYVGDKRNEMIRAGNLWRKFKRENESD